METNYNNICGCDVQVNVISEEAKERNDTISNSIIVFPSYVIHTFHHLHKLNLSNYEVAGVVFEIEILSSSRELQVTTPHNQNTRQHLLLPYLEEIELWDMKMMTHVWKCWNWNEFLILQKQYPQSSFHNLTTIKLEDCNRIKYLFSPLMAKLLSNLKKVVISSCDGIEEIVSNRDDDEEVIISSLTSTTFFPHLDSLYLRSLINLKQIDGVHDHLKV